jgi:hypothetical protein
VALPSAHPAFVHGTGVRKVMPELPVFDGHVMKDEFKK